MNWSAIGVIVSFVLTVGASWVAVNSRLAAQDVQIKDLRDEVQRVRDRLDKFLDERTR